MASSGSFSASIASGYHTLRVDWSQAQNVSANTSTITCKLYLVDTANISISARSDNTCTIAGTAKTYSSPAVSGTGTHLLNTVSQTVSHNSDGTKSITITAVFNIRATISGKYYESITATANITLNTISRASSVTASATELAEETTIAITRASSSFTHTLTYSFGSATGTIVTKTSSTSVSWTPPLSLANQIPNATSGTCTITCTTYNGSTKIGTKTCTLKLTVPSYVVPNVSSMTIERIDGVVPGGWNVYVQGKTKVKVTLAVSGSYGSTIASYNISGGGYSTTDSTLTTGTLNTSGSVTFKGRVKDSRGRYSSYISYMVDVLPYAAPKFTAQSAKRCTSSGVADSNGMSALGNVTFTYSSVSNKNSVTTATYYRRVGDTYFTNASRAFSNGTNFVFGTNAFNTDTSYEIEYRITDAFTTVTKSVTLSTANVLLDFKAGGKGLAVGKVAETDNTFEVAYPAIHTSDITVKRTAPMVLVDNGAGKIISLHVGAGGTNRGVYDKGEEKWILYKNDNGVIIPEKVFVEGHGTAIGTMQTVDANEKAVASGTWTDTGCTLTLTPGAYVLSYQVNFAAGLGKRRAIKLMVKATSSTGDYANRPNSYLYIPAPASSLSMDIGRSTIISVTANTYVKLQAYHDTGANLNVSKSYIYAVRIA